MSWTIPAMERRYPAREYVDHINAIGGRNRFGGPNFKIVWGQNETDTVYGTDVNGRSGQHVILKHGGVPAWFIDCWKPPECFGSPEIWYALTWNKATDAPSIGEFPWQGLYMPAPFNLFVRKVIGGGMSYGQHGEVIEKPGQMVIDAMPLTHWLIELFIPNLLKEQESTFAQRKAAVQNRMLAERQKAAKTAFDAYLGAAPAFGGKAGTYESNRERWMQRLAEKQAGMKISRDEIVNRMGLGHVQRRRVVK